MTDALLKTESTAMVRQSLRQRQVELNTKFLCLGRDLHKHDETAASVNLGLSPEGSGKVMERLSDKAIVSLSTRLSTLLFIWVTTDASVWDAFKKVAAEAGKELEEEKAGTKKVAGKIAPSMEDALKDAAKAIIGPTYYKFPVNDVKDGKKLTLGERHAELVRSYFHFVRDSFLFNPATAQVSLGLSEEVGKILVLTPAQHVEAVAMQATRMLLRPRANDSMLSQSLEWAKKDWIENAVTALNTIMIFKEARRTAEEPAN